MSIEFGGGPTITDKDEWLKFGDDSMMAGNQYSTIHMAEEWPKPNFSLGFGEGFHNLQVHLSVHKTPINRIKWWLFCKVFPCRIVRWE